MSEPHALYIFAGIFAALLVAVFWLDALADAAGRWLDGLPAALFPWEAAGNVGDEGACSGNCRQGRACDCCDALDQWSDTVIEERRP